LGEYLEKLSVEYREAATYMEGVEEACSLADSEHKDRVMRRKVCKNCGRTLDDAAGGACDSQAGPEHEWVKVEKKYARGIDDAATYLETLAGNPFMEASDERMLRDAALHIRTKLVERRARRIAKAKR
jgi:hypothetical protein